MLSCESPICELHCEVVDSTEVVASAINSRYDKWVYVSTALCPVHSRLCLLFMVRQSLKLTSVLPLLTVIAVCLLLATADRDFLALLIECTRCLNMAGSPSLAASPSNHLTSSV